MKREKVFVINGSPQGNVSGTLRVTNAFLKGMNDAGEYDTEICTLSKMNVKMCRGCLSCWGRTDGECVIRNDDVPYIKKSILDADVIIGSYPLYFFSMPGAVKNLNDRLLSVMLPYYGEEPTEGLPFHEFRYDFSQKKFLIISTCGFSRTMPAYEPLLKQYDCIFGKDGYQALLCPQGKVFSTPPLNRISDVYLQKYVAAGAEFAENGFVSSDTLESLSEPIFDDHRFQMLIKKFWSDERKIGAKAEKSE